MIAIIDYGMGNIGSVYNAFVSLGFEVVITNNKDVILKADKVILPGVGAFENAINYIKETGLDVTIREVIKNKKPILGICLGMQLLFDVSYEFGKHQGLKVLSGEIVPFEYIYHNVDYKIPHMGWNRLEINPDCPLYKGFDDRNHYVYFVHSYYLKTTKDFVASTTDYGTKFVSSVWKDSIYGVQFHPEKSGNIGMKILKNFGDLKNENNSCY